MEAFETGDRRAGKGGRDWVKAENEGTRNTEADQGVGPAGSSGGTGDFVSIRVAILKRENSYPDSFAKKLRWKAHHGGYGIPQNALRYRPRFAGLDLLSSCRTRPTSV